jgi:hypothetical protein
MTFTDSDVVPLLFSFKRRVLSLDHAQTSGGDVRYRFEVK